MPEEFTTYLLALEVAPMTVGQAYEQLPMHCTIMHRFHSALSTADLALALAPIIAASEPMVLQPLGHRAFGPRQQLVTMIELSAALLSLHMKLYEKLNELGVQYTETDWVGTGYMPHVTDKHGKRLNGTASTACQAVYLISVEHPLVGNKRLIEAEIDFKVQEADSYIAKKDG